jgi:hypothetical protein
MGRYGVIREPQYPETAAGAFYPRVSPRVVLFLRLMRGPIDFDHQIGPFAEFNPKIHDVAVAPTNKGPLGLKENALVHEERPHREFFWRRVRPHPPTELAGAFLIGLSACQDSLSQSWPSPRPDW